MPLPWCCLRSCRMSYRLLQFPALPANTPRFTSSVRACSRSCVSHSRCSSCCCASACDCSAASAAACWSLSCCWAVFRSSPCFSSCSARPSPVCRTACGTAQHSTAQDAVSQTFAGSRWYLRKHCSCPLMLASRLALLANQPAQSPAASSRAALPQRPAVPLAPAAAACLAAGTPAPAARHRGTIKCRANCQSMRQPEAVFMCAYACVFVCAGLQCSLPGGLCSVAAQVLRAARGTFQVPAWPHLLKGCCQAVDGAHPA